MTGGTRRKISARDRARAARARADAARVQRDQQVEAAAAAFFAASDERDQLFADIAELTGKVQSVEAVMGARVIDLSELGEKAAYQRELFGIDEIERKRLRALAEESNAGRAPGSAADGVGSVTTKSPEPVTELTEPTEASRSGEQVPVA